MLNDEYYKHNKRKDVRSIKLNFLREKKNPLPKTAGAKESKERKKVKMCTKPNYGPNYGLLGSGVGAGFGFSTIFSFGFSGGFSSRLSFCATQPTTNTRLIIRDTNKLKILFVIKLPRSVRLKGMLA